MLRVSTSPNVAMLMGFDSRLEKRTESEAYESAVEAFPELSLPKYKNVVES